MGEEHQNPLVFVVTHSGFPPVTLTGGNAVLARVEPFWCQCDCPSLLVSNPVPY